MLETTDRGWGRGGGEASRMEEWGVLQNPCQTKNNSPGENHAKQLFRISEKFPKSTKKMEAYLFMEIH